MSRFTIDDIRGWGPCYNPEIHLPKLWGGFAVDILKHNSIPPEDKLWVVCRQDLIDAKTLRLFAVWCARGVEHLLTDDRSRNAINVAERFANGEATEDERVSAGNAARDAARVTPSWAAPWSATWAVSTKNAGNAAKMVADIVAGIAVSRNAQVAKLIEMIEGAKK